MHKNFFTLILFLLCLEYVACNRCDGDASVSLVESIPRDLNLSFFGDETYTTWKELIDGAKESIDIACFYMSLTEGKKFHPGQEGWKGQSIFDSLIAAKTNKGVKIRIVQNKPSNSMPDNDTGYLASIGVADVRTIDFERLNGEGVLHIKLIVVDKKHFYVGSANLDWRSLSQVKELGIAIRDCTVAAQDIGKIFEIYWDASKMLKLPVSWPEKYISQYYEENPIFVGNSSFYLSSSPNSFTASNRSLEIDTIKKALQSGSKYVNFSVMHYVPFSLHSHPNYYWPEVDNLLREASYKGIKVNLLVSVWNSTNIDWLQYWKSLDALKNIDVRYIKLPNSPHGLPAPFSRVSHSKYIVTDTSLYITTSNCAADYYYSTAGIGFITKAENLRLNAQDIFLRDWKSQYTYKV